MLLLSKVFAVSAFIARLFLSDRTVLLTIILVAASIAEAQWPAILACPSVSVTGHATGTGAVIGVKDGFGYLLTAAHVAGEFDTVKLAFTSRANYPRPAWFVIAADVIGRWPDPDLALVRFPLGKQTVPILSLAPAWQRPKTFPVDVRTIGVGSDQASTVDDDVIRAKDFVAREGKQPAFFWRTDVPPEQGRSGGPLLDSRGRIIGITVAASGGKGYYSHHDEIVAALKSNGHSWLIPRK